MDGLDDLKFNCTRRHFLSAASLGIGSTALAALLDPSLLAAAPASQGAAGPAGAPLLLSPHLVPRVKRVIYLFQSGGPSQLELFDYKPLLRAMNGEELPESIRKGQRLTGMTAQPEVVPDGRLAVRVRAARQERRLGQRAAAAHRADRRRAVLRPVDAHRGDQPRSRRSRSSRPASQQAGRPTHRRVARPTASAARTRTCPAFVVLISRDREGDQPLYARLWGSGFLPSQHQGVQFRGGRDPVLYLTNPEGIERDQPAADARHAAHAQRSSSTRAPWRSRRSTRASPSTRWPTACRPACRS